MSAYNRYYFAKELYPNYLVLILKKGKFISFSKYFSSMSSYNNINRYIK